VGTRNLFFALILGLSLALACVPKDQVDFREHVLNRLGFGPNAWSEARINTVGGIDAYIEEQLHPETIPDPEVDSMLQAFPTLDMTFAERMLLTEGMMPGMPMMTNNQLLDELEDAKILRAVYSRRQLQEVLVDFWFNHFNVKVNGGGFAVEAAGPYERDAIRPHVLGRFEDMLVAVAHSPSMLFYLDNWRSFKEKPTVVNTRMNENYARELLELHTVGVDNYTQQDVEEVARCFTGWTIDTTLDDGFYFWAEEHDTGSKVVLGELLIPAGGGEEDGMAVLSYLARHPATAQNLARKLLIRFVSEDPSQELVDLIANHYLATDGDLREVMRLIFSSAAFSSRNNYRTKVKRPFHFAVSAARALGTTTTDVVDGVHALTFWSGEPLYREGSPKGFPDVSEAWLGVGPMLERVNFLYETKDQTNGFYFDWPVSDPGDDVVLLNNLQSWLFMTPVSDETRAAFLHFGTLQAHFVVGQKRIEMMTYALLSSPEFFLH
jgi:uncharacterized protein (DUF1800 family)